MQWLVLSLTLSSPVSPDTHARAAAAFLSDSNKSVKQEDKPFIRFLSWYNYSGHPELETDLKIQRFWINMLHFESDVEFPKEVPNTQGLLWWIDIRDYGWNREAWQAVALREPYFIEPMVNSGPADFLRKVIGSEQGKTFHAEAIVRGDWFLRESSDLNRSAAYFDLLFAKQRFPGGREEAPAKPKVGARRGPPGRVVSPVASKVKTAAKFVDFPKTEDDVEKVLGVDLIRAFIKTSKINLQHGAVVEGAEKETSIVARQNRLIERTAGPIGWYYKTFDVKETAGKRDFAETLNKDFEFDAGEILYELPAGGQGGLLVNAQRAVLPLADNAFATDTSNVRLDVRVIDYTSCAVCHETGIIKPKNLIDEMLHSGVDIKFKNKRDARDARAFFTAWERTLENDQKTFAGFIKKTSGFAPGENSLNWKASRDRYDAPVDASKAAAELGITLEECLKVARRSVKSRTINLVQGISMPRRTWEKDAYPEMVKLLNARKY